MFYARGSLPLWGAIVISGALMATDLVLFPSRRRYYTSEPANAKLIGGEAIAVSDLAPNGFVRINGELWQAMTMRRDDTIREGEKLRVREMRGLELIVDRCEGHAGGGASASSHLRPGERDGA